MKDKNLRRCFAAMEQSKPALFVNFDEQQQEAKTLGVRAPVVAGVTNLATVDEAVLSPIIPTDTLGGIVAKIHGSETDEMVSVVDVQLGVVHSRFAAGVDAAALIDAVAGTTKAGALKQLDPTKASGPFIDSAAVDVSVTVSDGATGLETVAQKPVIVSRNTASMINAIVDDLTAASDNILGMSLVASPYFIVIDQHTGLMTVFAVDTEAHGNLVRALFNDAGTLEDAVRYEQIPASEASGSTRLPLE